VVAAILAGSAYVIAETLASSAAAQTAGFEAARRSVGRSVRAKSGPNRSRDFMAMSEGVLWGEWCDESVLARGEEDNS